MKNAVNWFEIPVTDFPRAKKFYETILACSLQEQQMGPLEMGFFPTDSPSAASGAIVKGDGHVPSQTGTLVYLNADRIIDDVLGRIEKAGGKIVMPKMQVTEEIGHVASFTDTEGNKVALHAPARK